MSPDQPNTQPTEAPWPAGANASNEDPGRPVRPHRSGGGMPASEADDQASRLQEAVKVIDSHRKPSLGRIVLFTFPTPFNSNWTQPDGQGEQVPAIITAVWSDTMVNLTVFVDGEAAAVAHTSIGLKTEQNQKNINDGEPNASFWEWPPRV